MRCILHVISQSHESHGPRDSLFSPQLSFDFCTQRTTQYQFTPLSGWLHLIYTCTPECDRE